MSKITIEKAVIERLNTFFSRGENGMDIFLRDEEEGITTYYQIEVFGEFVKPLVERLHKGDHISVTGNLAIRRYFGKDGKEAFSLLIKNAEKLHHHESERPSFFYLNKRLALNLFSLDLI